MRINQLKLDKVKLFVLDEADQLVSSKMNTDIVDISKKLPSAKQVIASSATYNNEAISYLDTIMTSPTLVEPNTDTPLLLGLKQFVAVVKSNLNVVHQLNIKNIELNRLLSMVTFSQCLIFTNYQCRAESISNTINRSGWKSMYISSAQTQEERLQVFNSLRDGKCRVLLTTDITARGIDAANIDLVINYDVPFEVSTYLHRMGRAGRFGSHGICITIAAKGKELNEYCKILGKIGGTNISVPQLPNDFPNDLWNADTSGFELVQGTLDSDNKLTERGEIVTSIMNLKVQRSKHKEMGSNSKKISEEQTSQTNSEDEHEQNAECKDSEVLLQDLDVDMSNTVASLLEDSPRKEAKVECISTKDAISALEDLASGKITSEVEALQDPLVENSISKKRKRPSENISCKDQFSESKGSLPDKKNDSILYKNVALLNAAELLSGAYNTNEIREEAISSSQSYLNILAFNEDKLNETTVVSHKENILDTIATEEVKNNFNDNACSNNGTNETNALDNVEKYPNSDLEDIFKLSYDYATNSETPHWLDVLGEELEEKMTISEKGTDNLLQYSSNEAVDSFTIPKRKKHKTHKKKTFKDFTQKTKKNKDTDQEVEPYNMQEGKDFEENQIDPSYYYQAGLYSDAEYGANEHFTTCFDYYSDELTQNLQTFEDVDSFNTWFADWQWQVQGVRDYVQQNIYLQEMNKYTYYRNS